MNFCIEEKVILFYFFLNAVIMFRKKNAIGKNWSQEKLVFLGFNQRLEQDFKSQDVRISLSFVFQHSISMLVH